MGGDSSNNNNNSDWKIMAAFKLPTLGSAICTFTYMTFAYVSYPNVMS